MKKIIFNKEQKKWLKAAIFSSSFTLLSACSIGVSDGPALEDTAVTNEACEIATFKNAQENADVKIDWHQDSVQFISSGVYSRVKKLSDGRLILVYSSASNIIYRISTDNGDNWGAEKVIALGGHAYEYTNSEFIELSNGTWVYGYNARPKNENGSDNFQIKIVTSEDKGATWSEEQFVFDGGNTFETGVREPVFLELPSKELQLYFANESFYIDSHDQQISLMRSMDSGKSWSASENVAYRAGSRDGMPVPVLLNDKSTIALSIEDNGIDGDFKPVTVRTDLADNWKSGSVDAQNNKRDRSIVKEKQLSTEMYAGAPYLAQLPQGETLLSFQSSQCRDGIGLENSLMRVYIGDNQAKNFSSASTPFTTELIKENGNALWNAITVIDDSTIIATSSITTGDLSKPNGIYIVKGTIKRK